MEMFAKGIRQRWNAGHCDDDVMIVICMEWNLVQSNRSLSQNSSTPTVKVCRFFWNTATLSKRRYLSIIRILCKFKPPNYWIPTT